MARSAACPTPRHDDQRHHGGRRPEGDQQRARGVRVTFLPNAVFPLNRGGMRPDVLWTMDIEYTF
jgi:hypothetical protein